VGTAFPRSMPAGRPRGIMLTQMAQIRPAHGIKLREV
jgi:hypothetical protein